MKKSLLISLLFLFLACKETKKTNPIVDEVHFEKVVKPAPLYEDLNGNPIALADYQGKRLLLNYWATWCKPCIEEMPAMAKAQEILTNDNFVFLFASDQSQKKITAFRDKKQFGLNFIKYNGNYADLEISALPLTVIYNTKGEPVTRVEGGVVWDAPEMIQKLKLIE